MAKYLITGGAGFIGSNLAEELLRTKNKVRIIDDFSTGREENLAGLEGDIEVVRGSIEDAPLVKRAAEGTDFVVHLAAVASVKKCMEDPAGTDKVNIGGTLNTLEAAAAAGAKKIIFASSCAIYDDLSVKAEEAMPARPASPYGKAKLKGEELCAQFSRDKGLSAIALRFFNIFGPKQDPSGEYSAVIPKFITMMLKDKRPTIYGDGKQTRDFVHINNVIRAVTLACASDIYSDTFNIGSGESRDLIETVKTLNKILKKDLEPEFLPSREGEIKRSSADIGKASKKLGYRIGTGFAGGMRITAEHYKRR